MLLPGEEWAIILIDAISDPLAIVSSFHLCSMVVMMLSPGGVMQIYRLWILKASSHIFAQVYYTVLLHAILFLLLCV